MSEAGSIAVAGVGQGPRALATLGFSVGQALRFESPTDRRVAVQGVGFNARLIALQGFGELPRVIYPSGVRRSAPARRRRRDTDDDVLLFLLR